MTIDPRPQTGIRSWIRARDARFWATTLSVSAVIVLFGGSQIARSYDQSVNWYTGFGQWLGALGSFAAAGVALWISTYDRRDRESERLAEEATHARLVRLAVGWNNDAAAVIVKVRNFGALPILDVELVAATWSEHPEAKGTVLDSASVARAGFQPILRPHQGVIRAIEPPDILFELEIAFNDSEGKPLAEIDRRNPEYLNVIYRSIDFSKVVARIRFTTANGVRWEIATDNLGSTEPIRV